MTPPTRQQALAAAKALAASRVLGVHPRCTPYLRLLQLGPADAQAIIADATLAQVVKSEPDYNRQRPFWALELSIPHPNSPTGLLYVKPMLILPSFDYGYILSFKPSTDNA